VANQVRESAGTYRNVNNSRRVNDNDKKIKLKFWCALKCLNFECHNNMSTGPHQTDNWTTIIRPMGVPTFSVGIL